MTIRLVTAILVSAAAASAAAQEDLVTRSRVGPADAPDTLTFRMTAYDLYAQDPDTRAAFERLFLDMLEDFPGWQIATQLQTDDIGAEQARMLEQARAGRGPDCAMIDSSSLGAFKDADVLSPMTDHWDAAEIDDLFPFVRESVTTDDGALIAWWWFTDIRVLYRDTRFVPEAPATWQEAREAALGTVQDGAEGMLFNAGRWEGTTLDWLGNFWAAGGRLVDETGRPVFGEAGNRQAFLDAAAYYGDLVESGAAPARVASITSYDEFNAAAAAGTTAMFVGGSWQYAQLRSILGEEAAAAWDVSELPGPAADARAAGAGGWTIAAMADDPERIALCAAIARQVYSGEGNAVQGLLPTSASMYRDFDVFSTPVNLKFAEFLRNGRPRPGAAVYPEISNQIQVLIGEVVAGEDPEEALDRAQAAAMAAWERL